MISTSNKCQISLKLILYCIDYENWYSFAVCQYIKSYDYCISECLTYQYLGDQTRAWSYESNSATCDSSLATKWYRLSDSAGGEMPTTCVTKNRCGTHAPGWISGNHPIFSQGIQSVKVCFHWSDNCCRWSTNIRVRNCDGFYVYEFKPPPACHLRYCGNSG